MFNIVKQLPDNGGELFLGANCEWSGNRKDAMSYASLDSAVSVTEQLHNQSGVIAVRPMNVKTHILIGTHSDDTMAVLCHWHHPPTEAEVAEMIDTALDEGYVFYYVAEAGAPVKLP